MIKDPATPKSFATLPCENSINVSCWILIFHKVVQRNVWGVVVSSMTALLQIYCRMSRWENSENRWIFDEVAKFSWNLVTHFFGPPSRCQTLGQLKHPSDTRSLATGLVGVAYTRHVRNTEELIIIFCPVSRTSYCYSHLSIKVERKIILT